MDSTNLLENKSVLVTGGAGFIGSHLTDALLNRDVRQVVVVDNLFLGSLDNLSEVRESDRFHFYKEDASDLVIMDRLVAKHKVEVVFNLATKALLYSFENPDDAFMVNVAIARTLLHLQRKGAFKTLIHCSSSEAYGTAQSVPMAENHAYIPETPYAAGKAAADLMFISYARTFGNEITIVRPFNNYGPRQNKDRGLEALIPLTANRLMQGKKPIIYGDGMQTRDFIYVEDTVAALLAGFENFHARGQVFNIGSGEEITIKKVIQYICDYFQYRGPIEYRKTRVADVKRHIADIKLAQEVLKFEPQVSFRSGIQRTLDWYRMSAG